MLKKKAFGLECWLLQSDFTAQMTKLDIAASDGGEQGSNPFGSIKDFAIEIDGDGEADEGQVSVNDHIRTASAWK